VAENVRQRLHHELNGLEKRAQLRALDTLEGVNLCSNDYLGLSNDPRLRQAVEHAVGRAEAVASTGSRLLSGNSRDWEELESDFSEFAGTEAALYFTSGYVANVGLLSSLGPTSANSEEQRNEETPLLAKDARNGGSDQMDRKPKQPECYLYR